MNESDESRTGELEEGAGLSPGAQLDRLLLKSHPLMVEAFCVAAIPHWYERGLFAAIRHTDDGRDEGLYERLQRYTFVTSLQPARYGGEQAKPLFCVRGAERDALHRRWITEDAQAYREAHRRALAYMREHPDPNRYAQAQNELYHLLFVDQDSGTDLLAALFRTYRNERMLIAIDRLLDTSREAADYLALLDGESAADLSDMLTFLHARLAQLRGDWAQSQAALMELRQKGDRLNRRLRPYVVRGQGHALAKEKKYVEAMEAYREAYRQFGQLLPSEREPSVVHIERGYTLIALGDAHVDLAESVGGYQEREAPQLGFWQGVRSAFYFLVSLPLVLYLSFTLGRRVWNPQFWPVLIGLDWIIARLVTTAVRSYRQADTLLEAYGQPGERRVADEKLASVSLKLGDSTQARRLLQSLLDQTEAPLGPYRQAVIQVGLAEAHLQLGQPEQALAPLRAAFPVFETYEDKELQARAGELLGQALLEAGEHEEALGCLEAACAQYQRSKAWGEATRLAEHLQAWLQSGAGEALPAARERAQALIAGLKQRHYPGQYRHPWLVRFRQAILTLLPIVLLLAPLLTIHLDSSITLTPQIQFRPKPILDPNATVTAQISEGVARSEVYRVVVSDMALGMTLGFILLYLLASLLLGLLAITFTPLRSVQEGGRAATVCLDEEGITRGEEEGGAQEVPRGPPELAAPTEAVPWSGVTEFVQADVLFWNRPLQDNSRFGLAALQEPLVVEGHTAWYGSLRGQVRTRVPFGARVVDLSFDLLRSPLGLLYLLNLAFIGALSLLALFVKGIPKLRDLPGTGFAVDLYPFFYLFLVVTPLWWGVIQPLRRRLHLKPHSHLPLGVLAAGLLLTLIQALLRFRPLLTVINLYVPLATVLLLASGAAAMWRAQVAGRKIFRTPVRVGGALLAGVACLLMLTVMVREVYSYYHLVRGNALSTRALRIEQGPVSQALLERALAAYRRAEELGSEPIWGLDTRDAAHFHLEIPPAARFPWLTAKASQAAWQVHIGNLAEASRIYSETLLYTDQPDDIYATWAVARLGLATKQGDQEALEVDQAQYELGLRDLDKAIGLRPDKAAYHLWRAVGYHALGRPQDCEEGAASGQLNPLVEATYGYTMALTLGQARDPDFTPLEQERAWTGLGWIQYLCGDYEQALASFQQAGAANPESSEARLAEGYALYALQRFEEAQSVWEWAAALEPQDATILLALATAHWKLGGSVGQGLGRDRCTEYQAAFSLFAQAVDRDKFWLQTDKDVGFTHRTMAQMLYLLADCPGYVKADAFKDAVDQYSQALALDRRNDWFLYRRATLARALYYVLQTSSPAEAYRWLLKAIDDMSQAIQMNPNNPTYRRDRDQLTNLAGEQATTKGPEAAALVFQALADFEQARQLDATEQGTQYQPSSWFSDIRSKAINGNLARGDERLAARDYAAALGYYQLVAENATLNARAAFKAGLVSLILRQPEAALNWYRRGLEWVRTTGRVQTAQDALQELQVRAAELGLEIEPIVDLFRQNQIELEVPDAASAFELGLAALQSGKMNEAEAWYRQGLDLAQATHQSGVAQQARAALYLALVDDESLPVRDLVELFDLRGIDLAPETAQLAFDLAPGALVQGNRAEAARLYNRGIELAAADQNIQVVRDAGYGLRDYLLAHPHLDRAEAYWPLHDDPGAREHAVAALDRPDLYWRYRAEFGFRLLLDRQLMREQPLHDEVYEQIFVSVADDIERAYALDPVEHQTFRDFFVDANIGWLYLRRGDDYRDEGNQAQALSDYEKAATHIQPASENAALDLTEAIFKAGLTALRLGQLEHGAGWYDQGINLVQRLGDQFGLAQKVGPAIEELQALVEAQPDLAPTAQPILDRLEPLH